MTRRYRIMLKLFLKKRKGVTLIEYALIGSLVAVVAVTALTTLGTNIEATLGTISDELAVGS
ncbi:MAG: Flp family type IVb pilin [Alphaproteobacteria bacterium GM202ARS2]|nr:Flp family type IVb pilin [Alphaproteobacteria bacterium GM202ARS2]